MILCICVHVGVPGCGADRCGGHRSEVGCTPTSSCVLWAPVAGEPPVHQPPVRGDHSTASGQWNDGPSLPGIPAPGPEPQQCAGVQPGCQLHHSEGCVVDNLSPIAVLSPPSYLLHRKLHIDMVLFVVRPVADFGLSREQEGGMLATMTSTYLHLRYMFIFSCFFCFLIQLCMSAS